jgi:hypothetical protein
MHNRQRGELAVWQWLGRPWGIVAILVVWMADPRHAPESTTFSRSATRTDPLIAKAPQGLVEVANPGDGSVAQG